MEYMPRIVDDEVADKLSRAGAALVQGPKWCGKTSTCEQHAASALLMRDSDGYESNMGAASTTTAVYHYRDKGGLEVDAVLRLLSGRWAATEMKLGGDSRIGEGVRHLLALAEKVDAKATGRARLPHGPDGGPLCLHQARRGPCRPSCLFWEVIRPPVRFEPTCIETPTPSHRCPMERSVWVRTFGVVLCRKLRAS